MRQLLDNGITALVAAALTGISSLLVVSGWSRGLAVVMLAVATAATVWSWLDARTVRQSVMAVGRREREAQSVAAARGKEAAEAQRALREAQSQERQMRSERDRAMAEAAANCRRLEEELRDAKEAARRDAERAAHAAKQLLDGVAEKQRLQEALRAAEQKTADVEARAQRQAKEAADKLKLAEDAAALKLQQATESAQKRVAEVDAEKQKLQTELAAARESAKQANAVVPRDVASETRVLQLEEEKRKLEGEVTRLQQLEDEKRKLEVELRDARVQAEKEKEALQVIVAQAKSQVDATEKDKTALQAALCAAEEKLKAREEAVRAAGAEAEAEAQKRQHHLAEEKKALEDKLHEEQKQSLALQGRVRDLEENVAALSESGRRVLVQWEDVLIDRQKLREALAASRPSAVVEDVAPLAQVYRQETISEEIRAQLEAREKELVEARAAIAERDEKVKSLSEALATIESELRRAEQAKFELSETEEARALDDLQKGIGHINDEEIRRLSALLKERVEESLSSAPQTPPRRLSDASAAVGLDLNGGGGVRKLESVSAGSSPSLQHRTVANHDAAGRGASGVNISGQSNSNGEHHAASHSESASNLTKEARSKAFMSKELIKTEYDFVEDLHVLNGVILRGLLEPKYNIDRMIECNTALLGDLGSGKNIAQSFRQFINAAKGPYSEYCSGAFALATEMVLKNASKAASVRKRLDGNARLKTLALDAWLIKPVQRICLYPLLLQELRKYVDETSRDFEDLNDTIERLNVLVKEINEIRRESEHISRMLQFQSRGVSGMPSGLSVASWGRLVHEALVPVARLESKGMSHFKKTHCLICDEYLVLVRERGNLTRIAGSEFKLLGMLSLPMLGVRDLGDHELKGAPFAVELLDGDRSFAFLSFASKEAKVEWQAHLAKAMQQHDDLMPVPSPRSPRLHTGGIAVGTGGGSSGGEGEGASGGEGGAPAPQQQQHGKSGHRRSKSDANQKEAGSRRTVRFPGKPAAISSASRAAGSNPPNVDDANANPPAGQAPPPLASAAPDFPPENANNNNNNNSGNLKKTSARRSMKLRSFLEAATSGEK